MEWLVILGLGAWVWLQSRRIDALTRRLDELDRAQAAPAPGPWRAPSEPTTSALAEAPLILDTPLPPLQEEPLLLTVPAPPEEEPLLLDTPVPEAANEEDAEAFKGRVLPYEPPSARKPPPPSRRALENWIAENGLAWLGGGAAALAGIFAVPLLIAQSWFTPAVQMSCAFILGVMFIGLSEWARRIGIARPPGHPLVAALLAGAGAATLYATAWGAHGLHGLIGPWTATVFLLICALLLAALSFLHGQAFGVLAIAAAMLTPALASFVVWPSYAVTLFVCGVAASGFALAALRRWGWVAVATMAGLYFWFAAAIAVAETTRALTLLGFAGLGGVALALRPPADETLQTGLTWRRTIGALPAAAIAISAVLLLWVWFATSSSLTGAVRGPASIGAILVALSALAVRARVAPPATLAVAIGALVFGFMAHLATRMSYGPPSADFFAFIVLAAAVVAASAIGAKAHHSARLLVAGFGAGGTAMLILLAASSRGDWNSLPAAAALFSGAILLAACAWRTARDAPDAAQDTVVDFWAGAGALLLLLGFESIFHGYVNTIMDAALAGSFAAAFGWKRWRVLRFAALGAAVFSLGHALSADVFADTIAGVRPVWGTLLLLGGTSALLFLAGRVAERAEPRGMMAESLSVAGVFAALIGVFLALRWLATEGGGGVLDEFTQSSLSALSLAIAGQITLARAGEERGLIAKWRGHVLLGAGLLLTLFVAGLGANPWWGANAATITGPALFNGMLIAYLAPAALALYAARRLYERQLWSARVFASAGGVLLLLWAALELRRWFHGVDMAHAQVGVFEGACYALLFLVSALAITVTGRAREPRHAAQPFTHDLILISRGGAWVGLIAALLLMLLVRHPWWGAQFAPDSDAASTGWATLAQFAGVMLSLLLGRALSRSRAADITRFAAAASAVLLAWSFGHAGIRWLHHGGAMDDATPLSGSEGLLHALWPLALACGGAFLALRAPGRDTVRAYLYDLLAIFATAVWPALGFAGLGYWLTFNPYWGFAPADMSSLTSAGFSLALFAAAAWLSAMSPDMPRIRGRDWFERFATIACIAHLFTGATLAVRRLYHATEISEAPTLDVEMWTYSAVWALFGAGAFWLGAQRREAVLRWSGLVILLGATAYVFFLTLTRLRGIVQFGSVLGLAAVLLGVAWFARTYQAGPKLSGPRDMQAITPAARRERRRARRYRSP
ncbi:MAG: DUF2339 domain-containing protein [Caulobacterales bacterium]|nr:DUF2339 domain-containing protein [Caulobacterales bacterium]